MLQCASPSLPQLKPPPSFFSDVPSRPPSTTPSHDAHTYATSISGPPSTQNSTPVLQRSFSIESLPSSTHSASQQLPALSTLASLAANASAAAVNGIRYVSSKPTHSYKSRVGRASSVPALWACPEFAKPNLIANLPFRSRKNVCLTIHSPRSSRSSTPISGMNTTQYAPPATAGGQQNGPVSDVRFIEREGLDLAISRWRRLSYR